MYPAGLCSITVTGASVRTRTPSTWTRSRWGWTRVPAVRITAPFTCTRPSAISSSQCRLDATPARARNFWSRSPRTRPPRQDRAGRAGSGIRGALALGWAGDRRLSWLGLGRRSPLEVESAGSPRGRSHLGRLVGPDGRGGPFLRLIARARPAAGADSSAGWSGPTVAPRLPPLRAH